MTLALLGVTLCTHEKMGWCKYVAPSHSLSKKHFRQAEKRLLKKQKTTLTDFFHTIFPYEPFCHRVFQQLRGIPLGDALLADER